MIHVAFNGAVYGVYFLYGVLIPVADRKKTGGVVRCFARS